MHLRWPDPGAEEENVMAMLLDVIAAVAAWSSAALLAWGAAICMGELLASADRPFGDAATRPQSLLFR
jgi:hypothetical protein